LKFLALINDGFQALFKMRRVNSSDKHQFARMVADFEVDFASVRLGSGGSTLAAAAVVSERRIFSADFRTASELSVSDMT
jgi:hypothetical protein